MKGRNLILTAILAILAGLAMIIFNRSLSSNGLVTAGGIIFIAAGVINMMLFLGGRDKEGKARQGVFANAFGWATSGAAIILGLAMLIFRDRFVELVSFMFGVIVAVAALYQIFVLCFGARPVVLPNWLFIAPIILACGAVYLFIPTWSSSDPRILTVTGAGLVLFGIATAIEGSMIGSANHRKLKSGAQTAPAEPAKEVAPEKESSETESESPKEIKE